MQESQEHSIAAVILAGGGARRFGGRAKGALEVRRGVSIVAQTVQECRKTGIDTVAISANDPEPYRHCGVDVIPDMRAGFGPLSGIETGLMHFCADYDAVMFIPCDMPNMTTVEMAVLRDAFVARKAAVVFAATGPFSCHPLCAVVGTRCRAVVSAAIDEGRLSIQPVWRQLDGVKVLFSDEAVFCNLNSAADWRTWRKTRNTQVRVS